MGRFRYAVVTLAALVLLVGPALAAVAPDLDKVTLRIEGKGDMEGMVCDGCTEKVKKALEGVEGVAEAQIDLAKGTAVVTYDPEVCTVEALQKAVEEEANFKAVVVEPEESEGLLSAVNPGDTCCGSCRR